ncbi:anti-anti-sigma factor [Micromonospora viridifaciens]|uniref:Anti-anti-sigma factor n=1 Tax=Micromonospora viridifaciens TaxID=1881 RepID=A0A1C4XI76_MICVI|nr:STAS domain-containing protein [Micromonospora viridifaciens]SCF08200.1 anti-anti-sigma factor [Micromonospora viridifaciens]
MTTRHPLPPECRVPRVELDITAELDLPRLPEVGAVLDRILALQPAEVVIDLSECRHLDPAAIGLLLDVERRLTRGDGVLTIRDPHPRIRRILDSARHEHSPPPDAGRRAQPMGGEPAGSPPARPALGRARVVTRA